MARRVKADYSEMVEPVDTGTYRTRLTKIGEPVESKKTPGTHYVRAEGMIEDPDSVENGRTLSSNLMISGRGSGIWFGFLAAMGVAEEEREDVDVEELYGHHCLWRVNTGRNIDVDTGEDYGVRANVVGFAKIR